MRYGRWALCAIVVLGVATPCSAFNGLRKGFVLGGGLGLAPSVTLKTNAAFFKGATATHKDQTETKIGAASNFCIGYGWDERNLLVFEGNASAFASSDWVGDMTVAQGYFGPVWYHYVKPTAPGWFTTAGIGFYSMSFDIKNGREDENDSGFGLLGGIGYEFARHWQVSLVINGGRTSNAGFDFKHLNVETLVSTIAF